MKVCPTHKATFDSRLSALFWLSQKDFYFYDGHPPPKRVYKCNLCGQWHLTKQKKRMESNNAPES